MYLPARQCGFLLIVAVVLIAVVATMAVIIVTLTAGSGQAGGGHLQSTQALFAAESGIERALYGFTKEGALCTTPLAYTGTVGTASFSTTSTNYSVTSALPSAITSTTQTFVPIAVANLASYAPFGQVAIDSEKINYAKTSTSPADCGGGASCLAQAQRGASGTVAATHLLGASVVQNLCLIGSTGTLGSAQRAIDVAVQGTPGAIAAIGTPAWIGGNGSTITLTSYTVAAGSNRVLMVAVSWRRDTAINITGVSYGSTAMSAATPVSISPVISGQAVAVQIYYLSNPPVGTANVTVTLSGPARVVVGAAAFSGVDQTTPIDTSPSTSSGSTNSPQPSINVTTAGNNAWIFDAGAVAGANTLTIVPASNRVQAWGPDAQTGSGNPHAEGAASYRGPIATPSTTTMNWTITSSGIWALAGVALRPAGAGGVQILRWRENF